MFGPFSYWFVHIGVQGTLFSFSDTLTKFKVTNRKTKNVHGTTYTYMAIHLSLRLRSKTVQCSHTIGQNFRLHNGHDALALADGSVAGEHGGVLLDGLVGRRVAADLEHATPLGEVAAVLLVLGATLGQVVQAWWRFADIKEF